MIPWAGALIAKPIVKRYGPIVIIALVIVIVFGSTYLVGRSHGKNIGAEKINDLKTSLKTCTETAKHNAAEVVKLEEAVKRQNAAYAALERDSREHLNRVNEVHERALQRQASAYQRAVEDARSQTDALRQRMNQLTVAETCHEAWVEVTQ